MLTCPKCQKRLYVKDYVNTPDRETYRKLKCPECDELTYTVEMIIDPDDPTFQREWVIHHRSYKRYYTYLNEMKKTKGEISK